MTTPRPDPIELARAVTQAQTPEEQRRALVALKAAGYSIGEPPPGSRAPRELAPTPDPVQDTVPATRPTRIRHAIGGYTAVPAPRCHDDGASTPRPRRRAYRV